MSDSDSKKPDRLMSIVLRSFAVVSFCCFSIGSAAAQQPGSKNADPNSSHADHTPEDRSSMGSKQVAKLVIPDMEVVSQDGKKLHFFTDLIKGKKVLINFIYTSCTVTCPMAGRNFERLQERIGEGPDKDIFLVSVTTDPVIDSPSVLKKWSEKFNRRNGWTLVTGETSKMEKLLMSLAGNGPQRGLHSSLLVLIDEKTGAFETTSSLIEPALILENLSKLGRSPVN